MMPETMVQQDHMYQQLLRAFSDFQQHAEKLSDAYLSMKEDFKKVNMELDRKNNELAISFSRLEETQIYLNSILESMSSGVIGIDNDARITQFNQAAAQMTGFESAEVLGKKYQDVFSGNTDQKNPIITVLETGKGHCRNEKVIWHRNGTPVPVLFQIEPLKDKTGCQLGAVEIFNDISTMKALEQEMRQHRTLVALGEMAATVAHEIRNPLGAMGLWAGLLERDFDKNDKRRTTLHKITEALTQLNRIVSNLLLYSRPVHAQVRRICLQDIVHETVNFIEIEAERCERKISIKRQWNTAPPLSVSVDPDKLQQVEINLCLNAIQAMPEGGILTIACHEPDKKQKSYVSFSVTDTGIGIEKECIGKIFDPFYTTKESGTGLGLAIVKKYVEFHAGYINVKSTKDKGTMVQVFLPWQNEVR